MKIITGTWDYDHMRIFTMVVNDDEVETTCAALKAADPKNYMNELVVETPCTLEEAIAGIKEDLYVDEALTSPEDDH